MTDRGPSRWRVYFRDPVAEAHGAGTLEIVADAWSVKRRTAIQEARARLLAAPYANPLRVLRFVRIVALDRDARSA